MAKVELHDVMTEIERFAEERGWQKFHSIKNLAAALNVEASEFLELSMWLTESESNKPSEELLEQYSGELADVLIYSLRLCQQLNLDPIKCITEKIQLNKEKYPVEKCFGVSTKYDKLG